MRKIGTWKIALVLLVMILLALFVGNYLIQQKLKAELSDLDGIQIEEINYSLIRNKIQLSGLVVDKASMVGVSGQINNIEIAGIERMKYLKSGDLHVAEIIIDADDLYIDLSSVSKSDTKDSVDALSYEIDDLAFRKGNIHFLEGGSEKATINELSFRIQHLQFSSDSGCSWEDYFVKTGKVSLSPPGSHVLEISSLSYEPDQQLAELLGVRYFSSVAKENWFKTIKTKQSRFDFTSRKIDIVRPDVMSWIRQSKIDVGKLVVHQGMLEVFEDKRFAHCETCVVKLPQQSLLDAGYDLHIDSLQIKNGSIVYLSREKNKSKPGRLEFAKLYTSVYHLSNNPEIIRIYPHLLVDAKALIFDTTPLDVHFDFDLLDANGGYLFNGTLGGFDMVRLNDFLAPVKQVAIGGGESLKSTFRASGNQRSSKGDMLFAYQNMKIEFLSKNKNSKRIMSGLINELAINRHNVNKNRFRQGIIYYQRDRSRSIFHSLSQSLQSGIKSTVLSKHLLPPELRIKKK